MPLPALPSHTLAQAAPPLPPRPRNHRLAAQSFGLPPDLGLTGPAAGGGRSAVGPLVTSGRKVLPSLGLAWANCVNIRLFAGRHTLPDGGTLRSLQVCALMLHKCLRLA